MLQWFEAPLSVESSTDRYLTSVDGPVDLRAHDVRVPGDVSSAAYFIAAAALLRGSDLQIEDVGLINSHRISASLSFGWFGREVSNEA